MSVRYPGASERGGLRGPIAPPPHTPTLQPHEKIRHVYATDPANPESTEELAYQDELKQVKP